MARYELLFKQSVTRDLRALPSADLRRVLDRVQALAEDPRPLGCQKLSAQERYRIRVGRYRVVYEIRDRELVVLIVRVADRKDVYRR